MHAKQNNCQKFVLISTRNATIINISISPTHKLQLYIAQNTGTDTDIKQYRLTPNDYILMQNLIFILPVYVESLNIIYHRSSIQNAPHHLYWNFVGEIQVYLNIYYFFFH